MKYQHRRYSALSLACRHQKGTVWRSLWLRSVLVLAALLAGLPASRAQAAVPVAPTSLTGTPAWRMVTLSWPASSTGNTIDYALYRSLTTGGPYTAIASNLTNRT